ncbi:MAG: glucoamylase family protein [bacterium]|nr:glucoamylase family protein [bacterium]
MLTVPVLSGFSGTAINARNPFVVMDFDKPPSDINAFGEKSRAENLDKELNTAFCKAEFRTDTDLNKKGKYLSLQYDVNPDNSKTGYTIDFFGLDLSLFDRISLKIKGDIKEGFNDKIKIKISTWNDNITYILDPITTGWKTFTIPFDEFKGNLEDFNWEGVEKITFLFENVSAEKKTGRIFMDDIQLLARDDTSIALEDLKIQKYMKPRRRMFSFPEDKIKKINLSRENRKILRQIASDTWLFFKNSIDRNTCLVMDNITVSRNLKESKVGDYTNITNIGLQVLAILSAYDLGFIKEKEAKTLCRKLLTTLKKLKKWEGLFYNYYLTKNNKIANEYISSVDNGWMAAGLICLRNSFNGELLSDVNEILSAMNFSKLYNPKMGQLHLGYLTDKKVLSQYHYGLLCTEPRITSLIAIGKGDVPEEHWFKICRTLPREWDWQKQKPQGSTKIIRGVEFFGGYYTNSNEKFIPSWGGRMFETLMPLIVLDERALAPESLGRNDEVVLRLHIRYAKEHGYPYWGFSPCSVPDNLYGGYHEYGIPVLGAKGYETEGIVTPHAMILALLAGDENTVMENLKKLLAGHPAMYGEYGLYDSFDMNTQTVTKKYLALDQGMILISLCNYLNNGSIQKRFETDGIIQKVREILSSENFFD